MCFNICGNSMSTKTWFDYFGVEERQWIAQDPGLIPLEPLWTPLGLIGISVVTQAFSSFSSNNIAWLHKLSFN